MFEPGVVRDLMAGEWMGTNAHDATVQISWAINWLLPLTMAFLTLVLSDAANRWTNVVVGAIFASGAIGTVGVASGIPVLALYSALGALLIAWHVWKWPRAVHEDVTARAKEVREQSTEGR
ncbi:hypothetical protein [Paractinoplanes atraurantiacus]|uniref:Uncharacterized protein n=1 Tax=Paractinoplanes atraurantiacus TaxID=1036182 RepID=A0A285JFX8_9ACTN|nr:hypothetical protein [Actinoplanes atraurantiacus]SNY59155.1 hypothetical protein SAMN05421748_12062 [Actinoplanes atraurantiacus]